MPTFFITLGSVGMTISLVLLILVWFHVLKGEPISLILGLLSISVGFLALGLAL
jgi:hypothetical protein